MHDMHDMQDMQDMQDIRRSNRNSVFRLRIGGNEPLYYTDFNY
jgi:hypothetical protein